MFSSKTELSFGTSSGAADDQPLVLRAGHLDLARSFKLDELSPMKSSDQLGNETSPTT